MKGETKKVFCNYCNGDTNHIILKSVELTYYEYVEEQTKPIGEENVGYNLLQCRGCENCVLEKSYTASWEVDQNNELMYTYEYFPKRESKSVKIKKFKNIPLKIRKLYEEVVNSFNFNQNILCSMGLRTLLEAILTEKQIVGNDLYKKINNATFVPKNIRENLHSFRLLGNDATHELKIVDDKSLEEALYLIEDVLNFSYDLDYKSKILYDKVSAGR